MFVKVTRSGSRQYVQFVEAYRDPAGRSKQRTLFTLGRLDQLGTELNSVISGLMRITGKSPPAPAPESAPVPTVSFAAARDYGDVWTLTQLWNSLGFAELRKVFWRTRHSMDVEALLRVMVFNLKTAVGHVRMGRHGDVLGRRDNAAGYCPQGGATPPARPRMAQSGV